MGGCVDGMRYPGRGRALYYTPFINTADMRTADSGQRQHGQRNRTADRAKETVLNNGWLAAERSGRRASGAGGGGGGAVPSPPVVPSTPVTWAENKGRF